MVYLTVFLVFSATRFFLPSKLAFIPDIVAKEKIMVANSLSNTTRMIATVMGFAVAGFIVKWIGYMAGFYLDSLSFFVSAALIASITPPEKYKNVKEDIEITREIIKKTIRRNVWHELFEGFGYMFKKDGMKIVTSTLFLVMAGAGSVFCVIIVFVQQSFGSITEDLGVLGVFLGVGLFLGTLLYGKFGQALSRVRTIFAAITACGLAVGLFALYVNGEPSLAVAGLIALFMGASAGPVFVCTSTLIHALVPDEVRGRIFSSMEIVMHLAFIIFMFATAQISKTVSNFAILLSSGVMFTVLGIGGQIFARRDTFSR
jgi:predicted MFS family arabinose efflux permease